MVQIKSPAPGPVLSARSVYNLVEGNIKQPKNEFQLPIKETLAKMNGGGKRLKKSVKRLNTNKKKNSDKTKDVVGKLLKTIVNVETERRTKIKRNTKDKNNIANGKNIKLVKRENRKKKVNTKPTQSDDSCSVNKKADDDENLDICEESSNDKVAAEILARIERSKRNFVILEKNTKKAKNKKGQKLLTNSSEKSIKSKKRTKNSKDSCSMPLLVCENDINTDNRKNSTKNSTKISANDRTKKKNVSETKMAKKNSLTKTKRNIVETANEDTKVSQKSSINGDSRGEKTLGKKGTKRKIENSLKGKMKKQKSTSESDLVSSENNLLTNFLSNDSYEVEDSQLLGETIFATIINPITPVDFMKDYWEKKHLLIRAGDKNRFKSILSTEDIDNILRTNNLSYTKNIDITSYAEGKRETHNPEGRALASVVWDYYNSGCSIRMLNPQTFSSSVWKLLSSLQDFFNSFCGANVYLTPPGTQGFAPHWDDIEAFILQLEGKKRWKVYKWRSEKEILPRDSSGNFGPKDRLGELLLDCVLEPGDLLYFPRGYIHQAEALDDTHSLHITISTYQKNAWVDLLEKILPAALANAAENHVEFRRGLPIDYLCHSGIAFADQITTAKHLLKEKVVELVNKMMEDAPIDATIDQLAKRSVYDSLPPYLTESEKQRTVFEGGERWCGNVEGIVNRNEMTPETSVRLLRKGCVRLLVEEGSVRLFHSLENSREYHEDEPKFIEISSEMAPGIEKLIHSYPEYITVEDLPLATLEDKMILATGLWEKGIIISEHELDPSEIEEDAIAQ